MKTYEQIKDFNNWSNSEKDNFSISVIKGLVLDATRKANSGHPGGPMSCADFAYTLYRYHLKFNPEDSEWFNRDRFILSGGHMSMVQYALLLFTGWLTIDDIKKFRQLHSKTPGHPEVENRGVECTTGPLGQGFSMGVGMAIAEAYLRNLFLSKKEDTHALVDHFTYVLASDGDLQEPVALGSASLAGHLGLSKLIVFYDANEAQISGHTNRSDSTDYEAVFNGFQWHVQRIDGHDHNQINNAIQSAKESGRPSIIIGDTIMAKGSATMEGDHNTHGAPLPQEEIDITKKKLGLPYDKFYFPNEIREYFQERFSALTSDIEQWEESYKNIDNQIKNGVSIITFDRPDKLGAMNAGMMAETMHAIDRASENGKVRCILLTGKGRGFCSGQDLNDRLQTTNGKHRDLGATLDKGYNKFARKIHSLRIPVVVAVNGIAAGAGASIALLGDIVIAAESASFMQAFVRVGLIPDCGGTYALPRLVGRARALGMTLLGDTIDARTIQSTRP